MKEIKRGTAAFGVCLGLLFVVAAVLFMTIGFWKTLLFAALFAAGYFLGAVKDKSGFLKDTVNRVVPEKKTENINFREEITKMQETMHPDSVSREEEEKEE